MLITRTSMVSGETHTIDIPSVTEDQMRLYEQGALAQDAFPDANADEREFIMTGITAEEWSRHFSEEEGQ